MDEQTSHLSWLVRNAEEATAGIDAWSQDVAHVDPWTTSFNPGDHHSARLFELAHEVNFAAFVFARTVGRRSARPRPPAPESGQASPRDNVVFEAGLFGGVPEYRRTFILHERLEAYPAQSPTTAALACGSGPQRKAKVVDTACLLQRG